MHCDHTFQFQVDEEKICYQVKWSRSWESEDSLVGCEDLIEIFKDSPKREMLGYTVTKVGLLYLHSETNMKFNSLNTQYDCNLINNLRK